MCPGPEATISHQKKEYKVSSTKSDWLEGPSDLATDVVEDVPSKGKSIKVRGLPAQFSNEAQAKALKMISGARGEQSATVDVATMAVIQFAHGCVDPEFTLAEAETIAKKYGPAFNKVVNKIDELSGVDKEAIEAESAKFQAGVPEQGHVGEVEPDGSASVGGGPVVSGGVGA